MPIPISVFSLADVLAKSDAAAMNRRQMQLADMKMQEYERGQQNETTLANMFAQQRPLPATLPGSPSVPAQPYRETNSPESAFGLPELQGNIATQAIPEGPAIPNPDNNPLGRLEHQSKQLRAMQQQLGERGAGKMAFELGQKADAIDEKLFQYRILSAEKKSSGEGLQHPFDLEDSKGRLYRGYVTKSGQQIVQDAAGNVVNPSSIPGMKITKGNTYIQVAGPGGSTAVQAAPRAGGGSPSYRAPVQGDIEQAGKEYKESLEPIVPVMDRLDKLITPIEKAGGKIPGVGYANNLRVGQLANDKGVAGDIYRDSTALSNAILKIRSGLAVTAQEEARTLIEMGRNPLASAGAFMSQFRKLQDAVDKMHDRIGSQYGEAANIYDERQKEKGGYLISKSPWRIRKENAVSEGIPAGWSVRTK